MLANYGRCAQKICQRFASRVGISEKQALGLGAPFGSGMGHGETCGCVTGALLLLGLSHAPESMDEAEKMGALLQEQVAHFEERFLQKRKSLLCKELLGMDLSEPGQMKAAAEQGLFADICAPLLAETCQILEDMLPTRGC